LDVDVLELLSCVSHTLRQDRPCGRISTILQSLNKCSNVLVDIVTLLVVIDLLTTGRAAAARLLLRLLRLDCLENRHSITGLQHDTAGEMAL
jgi:hypothetical protein